MAGGKVGRFACIFIPMLMTIAALVQTTVCRLHLEQKQGLKRSYPALAVKTCSLHMTENGEDR